MCAYRVSFFLVSFSSALVRDNRQSYLPLNIMSEVALPSLQIVSLPLQSVWTSNLHPIHFFCRWNPFYFLSFVGCCTSTVMFRYSVVLDLEKQEKKVSCSWSVGL